MGKTYRRDARNDGWRKAKYTKQRHQGGENHKFGNRTWKEKVDEPRGNSPFDIPQEEHEKFA